MDASVALKRAIDLSRNLDGLFNADHSRSSQPLIASYVALDLTHRRPRKNSNMRCELRRPRTGARPACSSPWIDTAGGFRDTRSLHQRAPAYARALTIAEQTGGRGSMTAVDPLLGIARTYRLEFINGAEEAPARFICSRVPI